MGLYVFHHNNNNNINLINIYSAKTLMFCFANFFHNVACANFFYALLGLCKFFLRILPLPPPPPPTRSTGPSLTSSSLYIEKYSPRREPRMFWYSLHFI